MIFAKNRIQAGTSYGQPATFKLDRKERASKLSVFVRLNPVIVQISETEEQYFDRPSETEILLEPGFHTREFLTPLTAWRFKGETTSVELDFTAYA